MRAVILAALFPEARAIARAFHLPTPSLPSRRTTPHFLGDGPVAVRLVGVGARHLDQLSAPKPPALIMAGLAGALAPDLAIGEIVIQGSCPPLPGVHFGTLATSSGIVATPADKAALFRQSGALAVDMETAPAQRLAESLHIPFLAVRAISDTAAQTLNPALLTLVDPDGRPRVARALRQLAGGSIKLSDLLRVRRATNVALARLTATLVALIASGWPDRP